MSAAVDHVTADLRRHEDANDAAERLREIAEREVDAARELLTESLEDAEVRDFMQEVMTATGSVTTDRVARCIETERVFDLLRERAIEKYVRDNA